MSKYHSQGFAYQRKAFGNRGYSEGCSNGSRTDEVIGRREADDRGIGLREESDQSDTFRKTTIVDDL